MAGQGPEQAGRQRFLLPFSAVLHQRSDLTDIGLYFNEETGTMEKKEDVDMHVISSGLDGFLYPCYTDGGADVNHILYYTKDPQTAE